MSEKPLLEELSRAGHSVLDAVEEAVFGRVGGADAAVAGLDADPLERLRAEAALHSEPSAARRDALREERAARELRAQQELEALKAQRGGAPGAEPKKRTL